MQANVIQKLCSEHYKLLGQHPTGDTVTQLLQSLIPSWINHDPLLLPLLKNNDRVWQDAIRCTEQNIEIFGNVLLNEQTAASEILDIFNERLIRILHHATREFYDYILQNLPSRKQALADVAGYTVMDDGLVAMTFAGTDYIVQYFPCSIDNDPPGDNITLLRSTSGTVSEKELSAALDKILSRLNR